MKFQRVLVSETNKEYLVPEGTGSSINDVKAVLYKYGYVIELGMTWHEDHWHDGNPIRNAIIIELLEEPADTVYLDHDRIIEASKDGWKISFVYAGKHGSTLIYIPVEKFIQYKKNEISLEDVLENFEHAAA